MTSTEWFTKEPGGAPYQEEPDGTVVTLLDRSHPDRVRLPPALGGHVTEVVGACDVPCPFCSGEESVHEHVALVLLARAPSGNRVGVAECPMGGFLWLDLHELKERK